MAGREIDYFEPTSRVLKEEPTVLLNDLLGSIVEEPARGQLVFSSQQDAGKEAAGGGILEALIETL
ncbi:MAG TPA: hypothetical protein VFF73_28845 [Planctomycetota bacterium]|nr:hypothetical protein [Planctomycetota bacterium]